MDITRTCYLCKHEKKIEEFSRDKKGKDGRADKCLECNKEQGRLWREKNRERHRAASKAWSEANKDRRAAIAQKYRDTHKAEMKILSRKHRLHRFYDLTPEQYDAMVVDQSNRCAICGQSPESDNKLHVDHDHSTGQVRQLLCKHCNRGLGCFHDNPDFLIKASAYLLRHPSQPSPSPNKP